MMRKIPIEIRYYWYPVPVSSTTGGGWRMVDGGGGLCA